MNYGRNIFYKKIFPKKLIERRKERTDFIFWCLYTQFFTKMLNVIPIEINKNNNRCLADGEQRDMEKFLDKYQEKIENEYINYATNSEKNHKLNMKSMENMKEEN